MRLSARRQPQRERIDPDQGTSFAVKAFTPTHWPFHWHDHPELELTLIDRGSGLRYVGDHVGGFSAGDVCLLGSLLPHTWTSQAVPGRNVRSIVTQFPVEVAGSGLPLRECAVLRTVATRAARGLAARGNLALTLAEDLRSMAQIREPFERLARLWRTLARWADADNHDIQILASETYARPSATDPRLARVLGLIDERATDELNLDTVAELAGLGREGFCRWFKRCTGRSFVAYRNAIRVSLAQRLLVETERSITDIAFATGFGSLANFNRRFREATGTAPRTCRRSRS